MECEDVLKTTGEAGREREDQISEIVEMSGETPISGSQQVRLMLFAIGGPVRSFDVSGVRTTAQSSTYLGGFPQMLALGFLRNLCL